MDGGCFGLPGAHLLPLPLLGLAVGLLGLCQAPIAVGKGGELALEGSREGAARGGWGGIIRRVCISPARVELCRRDKKQCISGSINNIL